jgi:transcriptional regulator GlxA family with amidase domain
MSGVAREQPRTDGKIMMKRAEGRRSQECLRTLRSLAKKAHRSRSRLVRAFDATIGMSPMAFLRQMRVERMAGLLATTDLSIAEAARTVGWTDPLYASRCLHAAYGLSPIEYRRRHPVPPPGLTCGARGSRRSTVKS